jgi:hypothetical protein
VAGSGGSVTSDPAFDLLCLDGKHVHATLGRVSLSVGFLKAIVAMERVFIGVSRADATRKADEWWEGLRQTLRSEVAVGGKGPDAQLDRWAITIRFEDENSGP